MRLSTKACNILQIITYKENVKGLHFTIIYPFPWVYHINIYNRGLVNFVKHYMAKKKRVVYKRCFVTRKPENRDWTSCHVNGNEMFSLSQRGRKHSWYNIYLQCSTCVFIKRGIVCFTCYHWGLTAAESRWCMSQYVDWRGINIAHQYENQFLAEIAPGSTSTAEKSD